MSASTLIQAASGVSSGPTTASVSPGVETNAAPATIASVETWSGKSRTEENFPVGSMLIRKRLRRHVHAFYAFARNADDIADSPNLTAEDKVARLDVMEAVLLGRRDDGSPSGLLLRDSLAETKVTAQHARDLLVAFRRDATKRRYANWEELLDYCRFSAMPVGRYVLDLHGESRATNRWSDSLCASLQVLNHLQDCKKDLAALDRCYIPLDMLQAQGSSIEDIAGRRATPGLRRVIDQLLESCDGLNREARQLPRLVRSTRLRLEVAIIVGLARGLADQLRYRDPVRRRVKLSTLDVMVSVIGSLRHLPA